MDAMNRKAFLKILIVISKFVLMTKQPIPSSFADQAW
jgi:hypothetical protein